MVRSITPGTRNSPGTRVPVYRCTRVPVYPCTRVKVPVYPCTRRGEHTSIIHQQREEQREDIKTTSSKTYMVRGCSMIYTYR